MIARSVQGKLLVAAVFIVGIATGLLSSSMYHNRIVESAKAADSRPQNKTQAQPSISQLTTPNRILSVWPII